MPEEKKEKFTFSDKIKNSKPAGNKSFAKSSAKVGRDGKPKATLFERTRRDAPFFIAALVALLLLPFLYKYSGQASEEQLLSPGSEQTDFDPERYGFDTAMIEDPDGQVAQLAGRDSLSLIKGWGSNQEEDYGRDDMDLDASYESDAEGKYAAEKHSSSEMDVEDNTTNIYKRRAGTATRAAFRRTKIGTLGSAGFRRPGGSRLGINNWGGGLKGAAKKVGQSGPRNAPEPVSLQPLRAAGSRSGFGQGGAAAARKSKDNMSKANPLEALRDSYVKPVDPTRVGGLDLSAVGPGGGSGKLGRTMNITPGKEPWWWDMMKTRMQKEWEAHFNRKWNWINFLDKFLQNIMGGIANCLLTGDSDGDMGSFFGSGGGSGGKKAKCCGVAESGWQQELAEIGESALSEGSCKTILKKKYGNEKYKEACGEKFWEKGSPTGDAKVGFFGQRLKCLGIAGSAYGSGDLNLSGAKGMNCANMPNYSVIPDGAARKWNIYTYVVARNYFPQSLKGYFSGLAAEGDLLCVPGSSSLNHAKVSAGVGAVKKEAVDESDKLNAGVQVVSQIRATSNVSTEQQKIREQLLDDISPEGLADACVIAVGQGNMLPYQAMKNQVVDLFKELLTKKGGWENGENVEQLAIQAFNELDIMFIGSFAAKDKLAYAQWFESGHNLKTLLPLPYWEFENAYIQHKKITHKLDGSHDNVYKKNRWRIEGVDMVRGPVCAYGSFKATCAPKEKPALWVTFNEKRFKGGRGVNLDEAQKDVKVSFKYTPWNENVFVTPKGAQPSGDIKGPARIDDKTLEYSAARRIVEMKTEGLTLPTDVKGRQEALKKLYDDNDFGTITWTVKRGAEVQIVDCPYNVSGDTTQNYIPTEECSDGAMEKSPDPKEEGKCQQQRICKNGKWGPWENVPEDKDCDSNPGPGVVHFYDRITKVPCDADIAKGERRLQDGTGCLKWNSCKLTVDNALLLQPLDNETKGYVARAKDKFDKANMGQQISLDYRDESLSVANLIDAIMIDPDNGTVPANTVCLLGKTIGANSLDPQTIKNKTKQLRFDNIFGVFLAFIGYDAASFPSQYTRNCDGSRVYNYRFPCSTIGGYYYWGGYVDGGRRAGYKKEVDAGAWRGFPLSELQRDLLPTKNGIDLVEVNDEKSRASYHEQYADLLKREPCQYPAGKTVQRANVIEYINRLCQYGEQIKPKAWHKVDCSKKTQKGTYGQRDVGCDNPPC